MIARDLPSSSSSGYDASFNDLSPVFSLREDGAFSELQAIHRLFYHRYSLETFYCPLPTANTQMSRIEERGEGLRFFVNHCTGGYSLTRCRGSTCTYCTVAMNDFTRLPVQARHDLEDAVRGLDRSCTSGIAIHLSVQYSLG